MATDAQTPPPTITESSPPPQDNRPCCSEKTLAYLVLRLLCGLLLLLAGAEKFKSAQPPYFYSFANWHDEVDANNNVVTPGRWLTVAKPVYEFGGLNNPDLFQIKTFLDTTREDGTVLKGGVRISNFVSWVFYAFAKYLPYYMIIAGLMILLGFLNRIGLFVGGIIWVSLAAGQMILPDNPTVFMLSQYTLMFAAALALVKYNRFSITRF